MTRAIKAIRIPSPLRTLLRLTPPYPNVTSAVEQNKSCFGYTHGRGCYPTNLLYLTVGRLTPPTLCPQKVKQSVKTILLSRMGIVSKETVVLRRWEIAKEDFCYSLSICFYCSLIKMFTKGSWLVSTATQLNSHGNVPMP